MSETFNEYYTRVSSKARQMSVEQELGIVRCKDCKYRDNDYCKEHYDHIDRDDFCSRGERKDG